MVWQNWYIKAINIAIMIEDGRSVGIYEQPVVYSAQALLDYFLEKYQIYKSFMKFKDIYSVT